MTNENHRSVNKAIHVDAGLQREEGRECNGGGTYFAGGKLDEQLRRATSSNPTTVAEEDEVAKKIMGISQVVNSPKVPSYSAYSSHK